VFTTLVAGRIVRFLKEAGEPRIALVLEHGGELAGPLRKAYGLTASGKSR